MKKQILLSLLLSAVMSVSAQDELEVYGYASDEYLPICTDMKIVRTIHGGTIIIPKYEGNGWTEDMKGAFEYACKIWEEMLPPSLPINVTVKIGNIIGPNRLTSLSKVNYVWYNIDENRNPNTLSLGSQIKAVMLREYNNGESHQFISDVTSPKFFQKPDITITYNARLINDFSFDLNAESTNKYDFVTQALRDLGRGLGFSTTFTANASKSTFDISDQKPTPYEKIVFESIGSTDPKLAYNNATKGVLKINPTGNMELSLYAPAPWENGVSLNSFMPDDNIKLTKLLSKDFGKGTVIRDITDSRYPYLFEKALKWDADKLSGSSPISVRIDGSTQYFMEYGGSLNIPGATAINNDINQSESTQRLTSTDPYLSEEMKEYLYKYSHSYLPNANTNDLNTGVTISFLKKDGTWDVVFDIGAFIPNYPFTMDKFIFHCDESEYDRTCDGYLRGRLTISEHSGMHSYSIQTKFFVLDYLPQQPKSGFKRLKGATIQDGVEDEYLRDIEIALKDIEGAERIMVEQWDEGYDSPVRYEVNDFKKGYFVASVDKEFSTDFVIIAYNKNGSKRSEKLTIPPLEPVGYSLKDISVEYTDGNLVLKDDKGNNLKENVRYAIMPLYNSGTTAVMSGIINSEDSMIDVSALTNGIYCIKCESKSYSGVLKFCK